MTKALELNKATPSDQRKVPEGELDDRQLDKVSGGTITKVVDASSSTLSNGCANGQHLP